MFNTTGKLTYCSPASSAVGRNVDSTTCEIQGIVLSLEMSVQYYKDRMQKGKHEVVYICLTALQQLIWLFIVRGS